MLKSFEPTLFHRVCGDGLTPPQHTRRMDSGSMPSGMDMGGMDMGGMDMGGMMGGMMAGFDMECILEHSGSIIDNLEYTQCRVDDMIGSDMPTLISSWMSILMIVLLQATIVLKEFQSELVSKWKSKAESAKDEVAAKVS